MTNTIVVYIEEPDPIIVEVGIPGPRGADGIGSSYNQFNQTAPADTWVVNHNLGRKISIDIYSDGGKRMLAEIIQVSDNQVLVYFDEPTSGYALYL